MPELRIAKRGTGPALVMLHGWAMHGGVFAPLIARLEQDFTLYIVDLPGHGLSADSPMALELDVVARHIAAHTPAALWLGWSLGGLVALQAAQQLPDARSRPGDGLRQRPLRSRRRLAAGHGRQCVPRICR